MNAIKILVVGLNNNGFNLKLIVVCLLIVKH